MPYPPVVAHQEGGPAHPPPGVGGEKVDGIWQDHILSLKRIAWASLVTCHGLALGGSATLATRWTNLAIDAIMSTLSRKAEELTGVEWDSVVIAGEGLSG